MQNGTFAAAVLMAVVLSPRAYAQAPIEALDGVDPVLLLAGKEVSGKSDFKIERGGFEYLFASAETMAAFQSAPTRYEIQLNGLCARMGKTSGGRAGDYMVYEGKIYIFGSDECHKAFAADPKKYLAPAVAPMSASSDARARGRALIDRTVAAVGGASKIDRITTYVESGAQLQRRADGDVTMAVKTMWRFPSRVRVERAITMPGRSNTSATLMTPDAMWFLTQGHAYRTKEASRPSMEQDFGRQIVPLLHARNDAGFEAAALAGATIEGLAVDRVRVRNRGLDVTLNLDPATGRVHSVAFIDRDASGQYGEYSIVYDGYREAGGLMLPFVERARFNGAPDDFLTRTIESIAIDVPLEDTLFEPGSEGVR